MKTKYAAILNLVEEENKLLPLTRKRPVATLPIACRYRLIDFPFSGLFNARVRSASLFISGSGRSLYDHMRSGTSWGLDNVSGGGVFTHSQVRLKAETIEENGYDDYYDDHEMFINRAKSEYVLLIGSSILANIQIDSMLNFHLDEKADITVAYKKTARDEFKRDTIFSTYDFDNDSGKEIVGVTPLSDLPYDPAPIAFGLNMLIAKTDVFLGYLAQLKEERKLVSVENILKNAIQHPETSIKGYEYTGYLKAIEDISSYFEANMEMLVEDKFNALFYRESPVLTKSKNSAPTYYGTESNVKNSLFANDCEVYGTVENSLISRRNMLAQHSSVKNSIIFQGCFIDEGADLNYVILDKRVHVEKGAKLEGTRENPLVVPKEARVLSSGEIVEG